MALIVSPLAKPTQTDAYQRLQSLVDIALKLKIMKATACCSHAGGTDAVEGGTPENLAAGAEWRSTREILSILCIPENNDRSKISFSVTATTGAVTMYVSRVEIPGTGRVRFPQRCVRPQCTGYGRVDRQTYTWRSYRGHTQMIQIAPSDRHFCTSCNYIVGVYNHGPGKARFTVSSTSGIIRNSN